MPSKMQPVKKETMEKPAVRNGGFGCSSVVVLAFAIAYIVIGTGAKEQCPAEDMIPIFLIVQGACLIGAMLLQLIPFVARCVMDEDKLKGGCFHKFVSCIDTLCGLFLVPWLIVGSVYVYGADPQFDNPGEPTYCDYTAYKFAFVMITFKWVLYALVPFCLCLCCPWFLCAACLCWAKSDPDPEPVATDESAAQEKPTGIVMQP